MGVYEIIGGVVLLIVSIILIVVIMLQESKQAGLSSSISGSGASDSFSAKGKGRSNDMILAKFTKIIAVLFFLVTIGVNIANIFLK
jgi:preprotein translocase subunit SecG